MSIEIGTVEGIFRYPVKSMRGEPLQSAALGWHGLEGDRRLAFRRVDARGGFPWLSAGRLPELVCFTPVRHDEAPDSLPTHVRTPQGEELPLLGEALAAEVQLRHGSPVEMTHLKHGIFDEASVSLLASATVRELGLLATTSADARRFRPNVLVRATREIPFAEDEWVGGVLSFGDAEDAACVAVTMRDLRCAMVNLDPDTAARSPEVMRACRRANDSHAGVYATVTKTGRIEVGQTIYLQR